jgi:hypothetical protein
MKKHSNITEIIQCFSEAHHSAVQEVDTVHAQIEKKTDKIAVYSPLDYRDALLSINSKNIPVTVANMTKTDFYLFANTFQGFDFSKIPYSQIKEIVYDGTCVIKYRKSFTDQLSNQSILVPHNTRVQNPKKEKRVLPVDIPSSEIEIRLYGTIPNKIYPI